eukprot:244869-Pelagomonas_calceolata.AAC.6
MEFDLQRPAQLFQPHISMSPKRGTKEKKPQSRRLTASLFINTHEVIKKKRKFGVILVLKNIDILGIHMMNGA